MVPPGKLYSDVIPVALLRYFIVIDDIWDTESWNIIKLAFLDNGKGSIVITTSRIFEVAANAGETCKLEPLSYADSKELFYARLTGKGTSTSNEPNEQSTKLILEKCGGLPLAIITIASLLDGKPLVDWPELYNRIGFGLADTSRAENNTKKILLLSYNDLPCHLKTCLLYLSIFPEDHVIDKNTLVWKWIAEGFVHEEQGETLFKVGERYFNQLIDRSIIQPVEYTDTWADVTTEKFAIYACRVHDMVLDMICDIAEKENFVTILGGDELQQSSSSQNNARILAVQKRGLEQHDLDNIIGQRKATRSFNATGCLPRLLALDSLLPSFRFLRVLSLEGPEFMFATDYTRRIPTLAGLRHLRYLGLPRIEIQELPIEIGDLRCLQILDLTGNAIEALPQSVTLLRNLKCLRCDSTVKLPDGMGSLTSLEELRLSQQVINYHLNYLFDFVKELGKLTNLRVLHIKTNRIYSGWYNEAFVQSLNTLKKLEEIDIRDGTRRDQPDRWRGYSPSRPLRHLHLVNSTQPVWINAASLGNISYLYLVVNSPKRGDVNNLGSLPELRSLILVIDPYKAFHDDVAAGAFPKLRYLRTNYELTYIQGAMPPCLESREMHFDLEDLPIYDYEIAQEEMDEDGLLEEDDDNDDCENEMDSSWERTEDGFNDDDEEDDDRVSEMDSASWDQTDDEFNDDNDGDRENKMDSGKEQTDDEV